MSFIGKKKKSQYRKNNNLVNQLNGGQSGGLGGKFFPYTYLETKENLKKMNFSFKNFKEYNKTCGDIKKDLADKVLKKD